MLLVPLDDPYLVLEMLIVVDLWDHDRDHAVDDDAIKNKGGL
jgi:hypothetical protein